MSPRVLSTDMAGKLNSNSEVHCGGNGLDLFFLYLLNFIFLSLVRASHNHNIHSSRNGLVSITEFAAKMSLVTRLIYVSQ